MWGRRKKKGVTFWDVVHRVHWPEPAGGGFFARTKGVGCKATLDCLLGNLSLTHCLVHPS